MNNTRFLLKDGERTVTRDQILEAIAKFDQAYRGKKADTQQGWFVQENGKRYPPKWLLRLTTGALLGEFRGTEARKTLGALGFDLGEVDDDVADVHGEEDAEEMKFGIERDLQAALRRNIEQLEAGLKISDGGREHVVESGRIDITAEDRKGGTVVIELKAGEAGRSAVGQILAYMGDLTDSRKPIRGILVAGEFSPRAIAAARVVPDLQLRKYRIKFAFEPVGSSVKESELKELVPK
jgi:Endonuclease NucS